MKTRTRIVTIELERPCFATDYGKHLAPIFERKTIVVKEPADFVMATPTICIQVGDKIKIMDGPGARDDEVREYAVVKRTDTYETTTTITETEKTGDGA
jgi:hypothetical protein